MLLERIIYGLVFVAVGVVTLKFNYQIVGFTGRQDWIENKLGSGTTYFIYKILSLALIVIGIITLTGFGDNLLDYIFSPLTTLFTFEP